VGYGWQGDGCVNIKVVECYDNSDCSSGEICDKSGSWQDWNCKIEEEKETFLSVAIYEYEQTSPTEWSPLSLDDISEIESDRIFRIWGYLGDSNDLPVKNQDVNFYINGDKILTTNTEYNGWIYFPTVGDWRPAGEVFNIGDNEIKLEFLGSTEYSPVSTTKTLKVNQGIEKETFYRFQDNTCVIVNILPSERTANDYDTQSECETNIIVECNAGDLKCVGNDLMICQNNQFILQKTCEFGCENKECKEEPTNWIIYLAIGIVAIFIIGIIILIIMKRRKK